MKDLPSVNYCRAIEPLEESLLIFLQYSNGFSSRLFVVKAKGQRLYDFFAGQPKNADVYFP